MAILRKQMRMMSGAGAVVYACLGLCACRVCMMNDVSVYRPEVIPVESGAIHNAGAGT